LQAKAFTENLLRRKPVLKENTSFFGKAFFPKERFVLKEKQVSSFACCY